MKENNVLDSRALIISQQAARSRWDIKKTFLDLKGKVETLKSKASNDNVKQNIECSSTKQGLALCWVDSS